MRVLALCARHTRPVHITLEEAVKAIDDDWVHCFHDPPSPTYHVIDSEAYRAKIISETNMVGWHDRQCGWRFVSETHP